MIRRLLASMIDAVRWRRMFRRDPEWILRHAAMHLWDQRCQLEPGYWQAQDLLSTARSHVRLTALRALLTSAREGAR